MKQRKIISIIIVMLFVLSAVTYAQRFHRPQIGTKMFFSKMRMHSPMLIFRVLKNKKTELGITDEQLKKIENIAYTYEENILNMRTKQNQMRLDLRKQLDNEKINYETLRSILSDLSKVRNDMFIERLKAKDTIENILTDEQLEKIKIWRYDRTRDWRRGDRRFDNNPRFDRRFRNSPPEDRN